MAVALIGSGTTLWAQFPDFEKIAAYYQNFHVYSGIFPRQLKDNGSAQKLNYLIYAFANIVLDQSGNPHCASFDVNADYQFYFDHNISVDGTTDLPAPALSGQVHQLQELKGQYPNLKVLISIGGASAGVTGFEAAAGTPASRTAFVADCISSYIGGNFSNTTGFAGQSHMAIVPTPGIFDGFDIDWEFPVQPQDRVNFVALLNEFRSQLDAIGPGHILSAALPAGAQNFSLIDLSGAAGPTGPLDFVNLETYDYNGPWEDQTGFIAPLYQTTYDPSPTLNVDFTVQSYLSAGVPARKILMGIPFYGYGWAINGVSPPGQNGQYVPATSQPNYSGTLAIQQDPVLANVANTEPDSYLVLNVLPFSQLFRDPATATPWAFDGLNFWTYDDATSIGIKMRHVLRYGLLGASIFEVPDQPREGNLVDAVNAGLHPFSFLAGNGASVQQ